MEYPEQAIKYLEKCFVFILSYGTLLDQARLHFLYAKCAHQLKYSLEIATMHMYKCVEKLETLQALIYLKSAYSYLVSIKFLKIP
jgi:hypothetical protein